MSDDARVDPRNPVLDDDDIARIVERGTRITLKDGEPLFSAGEHRGRFHVVLSGAIEIVDRSTGEPRALDVHGPGQFTGDIDIVKRRRPVVSAAARGDTEVVALRSSEVRRLIAERPRLGDVLLRAFIARREQLVEAGYYVIRVIGAATSRDAFRVREFLSRNQVPFEWVDVGDEERVTELLRDFGVESGDLPVVFAENQPLLRNPSTRELADALGLRRPLGNDAYDLIVVGAGPAGLGAAVYAASEGLRTVVLEAVAPGGQAGTSSRIENYLGFPTGITGAELTDRATIQAQKFGALLSSPDVAVRLDPGSPHHVVRLESGEEARARAVLIATGADYRKLDVPGRERFDGTAVFYAATPMELTACRGSDVVVVGGGNSAGQAVMFLAEHTRRVGLLLRGGDLRANMSSYLADRIEATPNVEVRTFTEIHAFRGDDALEGVDVENTRTGETETLRVPAVFSFIGATPRTRWLPASLATSERGFVLTGRAARASGRWPLEREPYFLETSCPGVFAAGDVRLESTPRIASAVGEGAMAVKFVHAFLADTGD
ncbi:MAG TPA: FAD-dependent oxidoreductase [Longimicrobiales bacterium]